MNNGLPFKVLVADDHTLFRTGLVKILESFEEIESATAVANGQEALKALYSGSYDLVFLDLEMPELDGWEASRIIVERMPEVYVIMVSMHDSLKIISDLIEVGVHSYLLKNAEPQEMQRAIRAVAENSFYYNQMVTKALHTRIKDDSNHELTNREVQITRMICQEMTMKEIAESIHLSEQTVLTHRKNIMKKIGAKNAVGIARYALANEIVQLKG